MYLTAARTSETSKATVSSAARSLHYLYIYTNIIIIIVVVVMYIPTRVTRLVRVNVRRYDYS